MNLKKILFSSIFMVIGLQASEVDPRVQILNTLKNDPSQQRSPEQSAIQLKNLADLLPQYPEIVQDPEIFIKAIDRDVDAAEAVELLLKNGANPNKPMPYYSALNRVVERMYASKNSEKYKSVLKVLMKHGCKVENESIKASFSAECRSDPEGIGAQRGCISHSVPVRSVPKLKTLIDEIKAEIAEETEIERVKEAIAVANKELSIVDEKLAKHGYLHPRMVGEERQFLADPIIGKLNSVFMIPIMKTLKNDSSKKRSPEQSVIQLKILDNLLSIYPNVKTGYVSKIFDNKEVLREAIDRDVDAVEALKILLKYGADLNDLKHWRYPNAISYALSSIYRDKIRDNPTSVFNKEKYKPLLKLLMKNSKYSVVDDVRICLDDSLMPETASVLEIPKLAELINEIKAEIEEDETRALAAFMAEAGLNTKMATEMHQMLGNSEESLGRSAELKE